ncbi:hypothetical protein D3C81_973670 [compost metagenome]
MEARIAALGHRRHIGQHVQARVAGHGQRLELASLDMGQRGADHIHHQLGVIGQQRRQRRCAAVVGHVGHVDAQLGLQHLRSELQRVAEPHGRVVQLAARRLGIGREVPDIGRRHLRIGDHHQRHLDTDGDDLEVLRVVAGLLVQHGIEHHARAGPHQHGVTVRLGARHALRADHGVGAGAVLHHHGLLQVARHAFGQRPPELVRGAARGVRHHQLDRPLGPGREGGRCVADGQRKAERPRRQVGECAMHGCLLSGFIYIEGGCAGPGFRPAAGAPPSAGRAAGAWPACRSRRAAGAR